MLIFEMCVGVGLGVFSVTRVCYLVTYRTVPLCKTVLLMVGVPHVTRMGPQLFTDRIVVSQVFPPVVIEPEISFIY